MLGPAVPLPIPRAYHINWQIGIRLPFHYIFPILPPILYLMSALQGSDMDQDCVSFLQGYCHAAFIIILFMALHLFLLELVNLPVGPSDIFP